MGLLYLLCMRNKKLIVLLSVVCVLVLVIVICGATFLVRDVDAYSYYATADGEDYDARVVAAAGIEMNSSMFFVDEAAIKSRVENAYPNIGVINVKRSFPDKVTINYVVYERLFQYENGGMYYQCYSSGRIGSTSATKPGGYLTVKPAGDTATTIGAYFQAEGGSDRAVIDAYIAFMHDKGIIDEQMTEITNFIDLRRSGYIYIRMVSGVSIELHCGASDFARLMERGFAVYKDDRTEKATGLIRVEFNNSASASDPIRSTYTGPGANTDYTDEGYYASRYESAAAH